MHYQDKSGAAAETTMDKLPSLLADGAITDRTLVWIEGMGDSKEMGAAQLEGGAVAPPQTSFRC